MRTKTIFQYKRGCREIDSSSVRGKIYGAHVCFDKGSKWFATADSEITLLCDALIGQFDAPEGVTITVHGSNQAEHLLPSGGKLIITE